MRIINGPDIEKTWKTTVKCAGDKTIKVKGCRAELEISEEDLELFHYFGTYFKHEYLSVKCPVCGAIIQNIKIPKYVIKRWEERHPNAKSEFDGFDDRD